MENFKATVKMASKELTNREKLFVKDTTNAVKLDEVLKADEKLVITPSYFAILSIHNDHSDTKDYEQYVIVDGEGNKFYTGSPSFWQAFTDINDEMGSEEYSVEVYKRESKNYKGKYFLTCSII